MASRDPKLVAALCVPFLAVVSASAYQDFAPSYAAAVLVRAGDTASVYLPPGAADLFQGAPSFVRASLAAGGPSGLARESVTAFVAPPPSLLLALALSPLPYTWAARLWALGQAAIAAACLRFLSRVVGETGSQGWALAAFAFTPAALLVGVSGQSSAFLLAAACSLGFARPSKLDDAIMAAALSAAIVFKLWPIVALFALPFLGRTRAASYALAAPLAWLGLSALLLPGSLFSSFAESFAWLARHVVPDTKNLAFESVFLQVQTGRSFTNLVAPSVAASTFARFARAALLLVVAAAFVRRRPAPALGWAAVWSLLLAFSPLLWDHYLVVAPALLAPVVAAESTAGARWLRVWACVSLGSVGIYSFGALVGLVGRAPPELGLLVFLNVVMCVAVACWRAPARVISPSERQAIAD